jgi:phosphoenolpyruvate carboxylase
MNTDPDPHARLRRDVRLLGDLLGEVLVEDGGPLLLGTVEDVRARAKAARATDDPEARRDLDALLAGLSLGEAVSG